MAERLNTVACTFVPASPRITAYDIHQWINNTLRIPEQTDSLIQTDFIRRPVFINLITRSVQMVTPGKKWSSLIQAP